MAERFGQLARFVMSETLGAEFLSTLERIERALIGVEHALIGGQAVFFSGYRRFTKDIDVGVGLPIKEVAARLVQAGFRNLRGSRFVDPDTRVEVDVVKLPRCALPYMKQPTRAQAREDLTVPVLGLAALVALKVKVGRAQDEADVVNLLKAGAVPDRAEVVGLLRRMGETAEGYDRMVARAEDEKKRARG